MKLTKNTLKKLIKEELTDLPPGAQLAVAEPKIIFAVMDFVERLVQGVGKEYAIELLQSEIDSLKGEG